MIIIVRMDPDKTANNLFSQMASMKANFFIEMTQFCIKELQHRLEEKSDESQLQSEEIYRQIQTLDDPYLKKMFTYDQSDCEYREDKIDEKQKHESFAEKGKKKGRSKIKPAFAHHKPKAPTSSYLLYLHENKAELAEKYNLTNISEITKTASQEWKRLPEADKAKYCKIADENKARYREAMQAYREKYAEQIREEQIRKKKTKKYKTKGKITSSKVKISSLKKKLSESPQSHDEDDQSSKDSHKDQHQDHSKTANRLNKQNENVVMIDSSINNEAAQSDSLSIIDI